MRRSLADHLPDGDARTLRVRNDRKRHDEFPCEDRGDGYDREEGNVLEARLDVPFVGDACGNDWQQHIDGRLHEDDRSSKNSCNGNAPSSPAGCADIRQHHKRGDQGVVARGTLIRDDHWHDGDGCAERKSNIGTGTSGHVAEHRDPSAEVEHEERDSPRPCRQPEKPVCEITHPVRSRRISIRERFVARHVDEEAPDELLLPAGKVVSLVRCVVAVLPDRRDSRIARHPRQAESEIHHCESEKHQPELHPTASVKTLEHH